MMKKVIKLKEPINDIEHTIGFTGQRPKSLPWSTNENLPSCIAFKEDMKNRLEIAIEHGWIHFISGLALGIDSICAELVIELRNKYPQVTLEGAIPCPNQDDKWSPEDKKRYKKLKKQCNYTTTLFDHYTDDCMLRRNDYIVSKSSVIIAVSNGDTRGGTAYTIRHAKQAGRKLRIINPYDFE